MKKYHIIESIVGLIIIATATGGIYCTDENDELQFQQEEQRLVNDLEDYSPFSQTPVKVALPEKKAEKQWYHAYTFVPIDSTNIVYVKNNKLYLSENKDKKQSRKIADNVKIIGGEYIFAVDIESDNNPDVYWIDRKHNLRKVVNDNGNFEDKGVILSIKDYFKRIPDYFALCNIDGNDNLDIVYAGQTKIHDRRRNVLKAFFGNKEGVLADKGAVFYLGTEILDGLIARDVDNDNDFDLIYKLQGNDTEIFGLENRTIEGENPAVFENGFKENVNDFDILDWLLVSYIINQLLQPMDYDF